LGQLTSRSDTRAFQRSIGDPGVTQPQLLARGANLKATLKRNLDRRLSRLAMMCHPTQPHRFERPALSIRYKRGTTTLQSQPFSSGSSGSTRCPVATHRRLVKAVRPSRNVATDVQRPPTALPIDQTWTEALLVSIYTTIATLSLSLAWCTNAKSLATLLSRDSATVLSFDTQSAACESPTVERFGRA
jgi:hypothetical protein